MCCDSGDSDDDDDADDDDSELALVTTDDLLDELAKRFDHHVFMGVYEKTDKDTRTQKSWAGDYYKCMGMSEMMTRSILGELLEDSDHPIE